MGISELERGSGFVARHRRHLVAMLAGAAILLIAWLPATAAAEVIYPPRLGTPVRTAEGFELRGTVYNYGGTTTYHFEYGTTTAYGTSVPMPDADAGPALATAVSQQVTGLAADTIYHYRLVSTNSVEGTGFSADGTFSTSTSVPPTGTGTGTDGGQTPPGTTPGAGGGGGAGGAGSPGTTSPTVAGKGPKTVAKTVRSKGRTILATNSGRTLYTLSAETHGKFICTDAAGCTSIWHPLTIAAGVVPQGPVKLGTIKRPEGAIQVTYRGRPLYTFTGDKKRGQAKGEGLKDVGIWHVALVP